MTWITPELAQRTNSTHAVQIVGSARLRPPTPQNQKTAIQSVDYVLSRSPFAVETNRSDNGAGFQTGFRRHVIEKAVEHVFASNPTQIRVQGGAREGTYKRTSVRTWHIGVFKNY